MLRIVNILKPEVDSTHLHLLKYVTHFEVTVLIRVVL